MSNMQQNCEKNFEEKESNCIPVHTKINTPSNGNTKDYKLPISVNPTFETYCNSLEFEASLKTLGPSSMFGGM